MKTIRPTLTFNKKDMKSLITYAKKHTEKGEEPAIQLVGDEGIYFMATTGATENGPPIVFADEANPNKVSFDDWWEVKRSTWGGDDGYTSVPVTSIENILNAKETTALSADINPKDITFRAV